MILGLGETLDDVDYLIDYIKDHKIDRVIFYSLNPHKETAYANSSQPASLYYAQAVSKIRLTFPDITIICGTWIDNLANIGILILSGANGITKFPLFKMFGTKSKSWEYENEIRLIYSTSKRKGYNPFALKSIYFGLNMDEMHQIQIIEGLTNRDIRFYKM